MSQKWQPYILNIAIGIHSIFEGFPIGLALGFFECLVITLVILFHKWAMSLTIGVSFKKSGLDMKIV